MAAYEIKAFGADRMVIAVHNAALRKKIFQLNFKSADGSIFITVPYADLGSGRLGIVDYPAGSPDSLIFGENAPVTSHSVKYVHHPDGEAHFSLDGKIFTRIRRKSIPLATADGHLFTLMVQGLEKFEDLTSRDVASAKRGVISVPLREGSVDAVKFVGHLHSSKAFAGRLIKPKMDSPLMPFLTSDGRRLVGAVIATRVRDSSGPYLLAISVEEIGRVAAHSELFVSLMAGFDPPHIAEDHSCPMSFLLMMYPEPNDSAQLRASVGSLDR